MSNQSTWGIVLDICRETCLVIPFPKNLETIIEDLRHTISKLFTIVDVTCSRRVCDTLFVSVVERTKSHANRLTCDNAWHFSIFHTKINRRSMLEHPTIVCLNYKDIFISRPRQCQPTQTFCKSAQLVTKLYIKHFHWQNPMNIVSAKSQMHVTIFFLFKFNKIL